MNTQIQSRWNAKMIQAIRPLLAVAGILATLLLFAKVNQAKSHFHQEMNDSTVLLHTSVGDITLRMRSDWAPQTVARFTENVRRGIYNNTRFEVQPETMIYCGAYMANGSLSTKYAAPSVEPEPAPAAGHVYGRVGIVRYGENHDSHEFYICLKSFPRFDGNLTIFAEVVDGFQSLEALAQHSQFAEASILNEIQLSE